MRCALLIDARVLSVAGGPPGAALARASPQPAGGGAGPRSAEGRDADQGAMGPEHEQQVEDEADADGDEVVGA